MFADAGEEKQYCSCLDERGRNKRWRVSEMSLLVFSNPLFEVFLKERAMRKGGAKWVFVHLYCQL
jgi:hypothetical protein